MNLSNRDLSNEVWYPLLFYCFESSRVKPDTLKGSHIYKDLSTWFKGGLGKKRFQLYTRPSIDDFESTRIIMKTLGKPKFVDADLFPGPVRHRSRAREAQGQLGAENGEW